MGRAWTWLVPPLLAVALHLVCYTPVLSQNFPDEFCRAVQLNSSNQVVVISDGSLTLCLNVTAPPGTAIRATLHRSVAIVFDYSVCAFSFDGFEFFSTRCREKIEVFSPRELLTMVPPYNPGSRPRFSFEAVSNEQVCGNGDHLCTFNNGSFCIGENTTCLCLTDGYCYDYEEVCPYIVLDSNQAVSISEEVGLYSEWSGDVTKGTSCWAVPVLYDIVINVTFQSSVDQFFTRITHKTFEGVLIKHYDSFVVPRTASFVNGFGLIILSAALYNESSNSTFSFNLQKNRFNIDYFGGYQEGRVTCRPDEFKCGTGGVICYDSTIVCDGRQDCDLSWRHDERDCDYCENDDQIILPRNSSYDIKYPAGQLRGDPTILTSTRASCSWTVQASSDQVIRIRFLVPTTHSLLKWFQLNFFVGSPWQPVAAFWKFDKSSMVIHSSEVRITFSKIIFEYPSRLYLRIESEYPASCKNETEFSCVPDNVCIPISKRCDGFPDCDSKADEIGCGTCYSHQFRCLTSDGHSTCVFSSYICDQQPHCQNMYDELNCATCGPPVDVSDGGIYQLTSPHSSDSQPITCVWLVYASPGHLINIRVTDTSLIISGNIRVGSGHDPSNESSTIINKSTGTIPEGFTVHLGRAWISCVVSNNNFSFEITQLSEVVQCNTTTEFACSSGVQCVAADLRCDSLRHCDDYSDELGCLTCSKDQYLCGHQGECVDSQQICDISNDCGNFEDEWECYSTCGPSLVNVNISAVLSVPSIQHSIYVCVWQITSDLNTYLTMEVVTMEIGPESYISFGNGHEISSMLAKETDMQVAGTLYLFYGNQMWMVAHIFSDAFDFEATLNAGTIRGSCDAQSLQSGSKCVPGSSRCNGRADLPDYSDEVDCGVCGTTNLNLSTHKEVVTVEVAYGHDGYKQQLVTVSVRDHQNIPLVIANTTSNISECVWKVSSSRGTRIEITVARFVGTNLRIGNGHDPSEGAPIWSHSETLLSRKTLFSSGSAVWITTVVYSYHWEPYQLQFTLRNFTSIDCDEGQFACTSETMCLNQSSVCNGIHECPTYADELSCTSCQEEFLCSTGECIAIDNVCNRYSDCPKRNDEFNCGFCGETNIALNASVSRFFTAAFDVNRENDCVWTVTAEPSTRILITVTTHRYLSTTFCDGNYGDFVRDSNRSGCTELATLQGSTAVFRRQASSSGPALWIEDTVHSYYDNRDLTLTLSQFVDIVCQNGEYMCPSGRTCIDQSAVCDGWPDCPEYEDEFGCRGCSKEEFACRTGSECYEKQHICDGSLNCNDFSDEFHCGPCSDRHVNMTLGYANLTSPGWPWNYPTNIRCYWFVLAPEDHRILVIFLEFETENRFDYLKWSSGRTLTDGLKISGSNSPSRIASRGTELSLHFFSDWSIEEKGFLLQLEQRPTDEISCEVGEVMCQYTEFICVPPNTEVLQCPQNNCGEDTVLVDFLPVNFSSPNYPANYPAALDCTWTITTSWFLVIFVQIEDFYTEALYDVVQFQGPTFYGDLTSDFKMDGTTKVRSMVFNSSSMFIKFTSDTARERRGFRVSIETVPIFSPHFTWCDVDESSGEDCETMLIEEIPVSCDMHNNSLFDCKDGSCVIPEARCDGFTDCNSGLDEQNCENIHCPEFYACNVSSKCIYWQEVCDGTADCGSGDDEIDCVNKRCPNGCKCSYDVDDFHVRCQQGWSQNTLANTAKRTGALELSHGDIRTLELGAFKGLHYLQALYLTDNNIQQIDQGAFAGLNITYLDISNNNITRIDSPIFYELEQLETLMMVNVPIRSISAVAFLGLSSLKTLVIIAKLRGDMFIEVEKGAFQELKSLQTVYVDDYRLCCDFVELEHFSVETDCRTTELQPPLNLCGSLLQNHVLRVALWVLGLSALLGNVVVIIWRIKGAGGRGGKKTHSFMVLNLAISDFMMGVYMLMIAGADLSYGEAYFRTASVWRSTVVCKIAGVISVLSSEASVFFVTLISIDCFLCIAFPFSRGIHLQDRSTKIVVGLLWFVAVCLSVVPTVSVGPDSDLYGLSDVCIGLPFTTKAAGADTIQAELNTNNPLGSQQLTLNVGTDKKPAWILSVVLFLGVNLVCFLVVFCCYVAIFVSVKRSSKLVRKSAHRNREIKMAVKMAVIVGTDFACWMPVIIMGILSQTNTIDIGADMYGWIVVFILPINSSLNPYLYTIYSACTPRATSNSNSIDKPDKKNRNTRSVETLDVSMSELK
ncbi:uncharacterized protein LOC119721550 [Patiria miniata]|uniref:G-protein coupled receptor GRL101 n=1 Tax=Patiria miniata TaxID=46514 RepID=A0A913Z6X1_PATMI|nr:uncharacterized protein LOC119721550 [Patiria miniata]